MSPSRVFVREATGLVREMNWFDYAITSMNVAGLLPPIALTPFWIYIAIPGGDPVIGIVVACLFGIFGFIALYAMTAATFPRSGSPYVMQSRALAPWIGWPSEILLWFSFVIYVGTYPSAFFFQWAVTPSLYAMGISTGNATLIAAASWLMTDITPTLVFGTVFLLFSMLIAISGTRRMIRTVQLPITIITVIAVLLMIGVFATSSTQRFIELMPKYLGNNYEGIIAAGKDLPSTVPIAYAFYPIMASAAISSGQNLSVWGSYGAGEVKRGGDAKMQIYSMMIPSIIITAFCVIFYLQLYGLIGRDFMISLVNYSYIGSDVIKAPLSWGGVSIPYVALMLADNYWLQLIMLLGLMCAVLAFVPGSMLIMTRDMFAWSFDRLLPAKFSEVSERFHSPVWSIVAIFIMTWITLIVSVFYPQYIGTIFTVSWATFSVSAVIFSVSGVVLPARKHLWQLSPVKNWKLVGIPVISIVSIVSLIYFLFGTWVYTFTPATGFGLPHTIIIIVISVIPFLLYWIIRAYRKSQGIDIDLIFREVPPE